MLRRRNQLMYTTAGLGDTRPTCGEGTVNQDNYDLMLHIAAVFIVLVQSTFGCGFPVMAKRVKWLKIPASVFFFCKHFGTGVLIATAFIHLLPTAFASLTDPCLPPWFTDIYPATPGAIMMVSMFALFLIELWLHSTGNTHTHGGATGATINHVHNPQIMHRKASVADGGLANGEREVEGKEWPMRDKTPGERSESPTLPRAEIFNMDDAISNGVPTWFLIFYEAYTSQMSSILDKLPSTPSYPALSPSSSTSSINTDIEMKGDLSPHPVDPALLRKMSLNITLLEAGILFHSIFIGMTLSVTTDGFLLFLVAILFHQTFEGLGLGSRIAAVPYPSSSLRPWLLCLAFGVTTPIGQVIGLLLRNSYDPSSGMALIMVGTFNAVSAGLLVYAALVDLLVEDFLSERASMEMSGAKKAGAVCFVGMGAVGMGVVGAFA